ncbi:PGRS-family protein [Sinomonas mesophila]|uniref:PGRS-family protein n=1 Tax=Sinomonas mesophila TaxID=1531955 RepID=UPI0011155645|nr:PGRS-family protein [Sinomonas mesophila]
MKRSYMALGVAAVLLTGCAPASPAPHSASPATTSETSTPSVTPTPSATPTPTKTSAADATAIAERIKTGVPSITGITTVTETNDSNQLIGRPGQYTSAAWVADSGAVVGATGADGGAVVEVFATEADAAARSIYIQETLTRLGPAFGTEWHHLSGATLLRVSGKLAPSVNEQYKLAFVS